MSHPTAPHQQSLDDLCRRAARSAESEFELDLDAAATVDRSRFFICESLTPLYHTPSYARLTPAQQLRYNQIAGMCHIEMITFVEDLFARDLLGALLRVGRGRFPDELLECLRAFLREETLHTAMFHRLKRLSSPRYADRDYYILRPRPALRALLGGFTRRPAAFPFVVWIALLLEEFSIEVTRRTLRVPRESVDPLYASTLKAHLADEARHVQIDWHLIERLYTPASPATRRLSARLLRFAMRRFFMWPRRLTIRLARLLVDDCPELVPVLPQLEADLAALDRQGTLRASVFSRSTHPIASHLLDLHPEMGEMRRLLSVDTSSGIRAMEISRDAR